MTDKQVYERALTQLKEYEERAARLRAFVETYQEVVREIAAGGTQAYTPPPTMEDKPHEPVALPPVVDVQDNGHDTSVEDTDLLAVSVLKEQRRYLRRRELYEFMLQKGLVILGKNPLEALGTRLYRSKRVYNAEGRGYWIIGEPEPGVNDQTGDVIVAEPKDDNRPSGALVERHIG